MHRGYVKIWRCFEGSQTWSRGANTVFVALALLLRANHKEAWFLGRKIMRGQLALGSESFAASLGLSRGAFRRALINLETDGFLTTLPANKYTLVTILNYDTYQDGAEDDRPADGTANRTASGTADEPTAGQRPATNKNDKELKKCVSRVRSREALRKPVDKSESVDRKAGDSHGGAHGGWIAPTEQEVAEYALSHGRYINARRFVAHWEAAGWVRGAGRVSDWRPLVRLWRDDREASSDGWNQSFAASRRGVEDILRAQGTLRGGQATEVACRVRGELGTFYRPGDAMPNDAAFLGARAAVDAWKATKGADATKGAAGGSMESGKSKESR